MDNGSELLMMALTLFESEEKLMSALILRAPFAWLDSDVSADSSERLRL